MQEETRACGALTLCLSKEEDGPCPGIPLPYAGWGIMGWEACSVSALRADGFRLLASPCSLVMPLAHG